MGQFLVHSSQFTVVGGQMRCDRALIECYLPELPKPLAARADTSSVSTSWTSPVSTGTGII
jgi:hypothetical protein